MKTEIPKLTELWREATKEVKSSTSRNKDEVIENFNQCVLENIMADFRDFVCLDKNNYIYARRLDMMMFLEVDWYCAQSDNTTWLCKIAKTLKNNLETLKLILRPSICKSERQKRHFTIISTKKQTKEYYCANRDEIRRAIISDDLEWALDKVTALKILAKYVNVVCCIFGVVELV